MKIGNIPVIAGCVIMAAASPARADTLHAGGNTDGRDFDGDISASFSNLDLSASAVPDNYIIGGNATVNGYTGAVNGSVEATLSNVNLGASGCVVGGNYSYPNWSQQIEGTVGAISGDITLNLDNVLAYNVYGGNMISSVVKDADYSALPSGVENLTINIDGADTNIARAVRASNAYNGYNDTAALAGTAIKNATVNMKNGYVGTIMPVTGGNYAGNVAVNVSGGEVGTIIGSIGGIIGGNYSINISGGKITGDVVGGFEPAEGERNSSAVKGDVSITVGSSENKVSIGGDIIAGGMDSATKVEGGASVAFVGSGENLDFAGTVYASGKDGSTVLGAKTAAFGNAEQSFTGTFRGEISGFDRLIVGSGSDVLLEKSAALETLSIYSDAKIGFAAAEAGAAQNLSFDNLEIILADSFQDGGSVDFTEIFGETISLAGISEDKVSVTNSSGAAVAGFDFAKDSDGNITGISNVVIPEPLSAAAALGAFALFLAACRKRK